MQAYNINADCFIPSMPILNDMSTKSVTQTDKKAVKAQGSQKDKFKTKYKTELCKNWIEVGFCRYS